ncbi:PREDICTED: uncharacterized protein LOC104823469 isoform X2 [Tarenaya hassleriana]|uniref:uncharacterized protein LOC104823469 isoform X2 n=1 Tax=Tarenaya hassleriana TaxID=28532 RepID=UPI00053C7245|nr:PREDICTED: uncharacterized protein LOC104823469 isoform X2 [Tarenaya hassleriana]
MNPTPLSTINNTMHEQFTTLATFNTSVSLHELVELNRHEETQSTCYVCVCIYIRTTSVLPHIHMAMAEKSKGKASVSGVDEDHDRTELSSVLEKLSLGSEKTAVKKKKKLLVLSLGGLLVHRAHEASMPKSLMGRSPDATYGFHYVYKRPFCEEFMRFCLDRFEVGIWSSAIERNVDAVLNAVMKGLKGKLLFVMDQKDCINSGFMSLEKKTKPLFFKDLSRVFRKVNSRAGKPVYSCVNTLMIDDTPYKAFLNPGNCGIFPVAFDPGNDEDDLLDPEGELCSYLDELADASDVQDYVRNHPFGQPEIGPTHPHWRFYTRVAAAVNKI